MTITAPRTRSDFEGFLNPAMSAPIFDQAERMSAFQRLFRRVPLGINGQSIPVVTARPTANWVDEGGRKPTTEMGLGLKNITPKKMAAITVMSAEAVRANPGGITEMIRPKLAEAFAVAFDYAVGFNKGGDGTGTGPFDNWVAETTKAVELGTAAQADGGIHADIVAGLSLLVADKKRLTGFAMSDEVEPLFWGATDNTGRPLYVDLPVDEASAILQQNGAEITRPGRLLNRPAWLGAGVSDELIRGFGGDYTQGAWGAVGGISYRVSTEATVTINGELTSLWEHNLVAVLAEAEYGFILNDPEAMVAFKVAA